MIPVREWMRDKRVAGALAAAAVLVVAYRFVGSGKGPAPPVPAASVASPPGAAAPGPPAADLSASPAPPSATVPAGGTGPSWSWNRNPFLPPVAERTASYRLPGGGGAEAPPAREAGGIPELRGTVVSGESSMAIFGDRLVPVGGTVGEWALTRVEPYRVSLRRGKETRVLEMYKP
ncbi:MAG: hypothetical protein OHK0028_15720 [Deltaproteobacteria bacterium]